MANFLRWSSSAPLVTKKGLNRQSKEAECMIFFDEHENAIPCEQWLNTYLPYYFLDYPKWGGRPRNQTSHYVEDEVCTLIFHVVTGLVSRPSAPFGIVEEVVG